MKVLDRNPPGFIEFASPIGPLLLAGDEHGLQHLVLPSERQPRRGREHWRPAPQLLAEPRRQVEAYLAGELRQFSLPLNADGTEFQRSVWRALQALAYGSTTSYAAIAAAIGKPAAVRAVGLANGRNPLPLIVPCHRVIGRDGSLTGFGGGLPLKAWLLRLEAGGAEASRLS